MSNSREKKPADKKSIQFSCRNTEIQQWWHLGTHTHNLSMNILQELVNNTSSQYTAQTCKTQGLSSLKGKEGMGGHA